MIDWIALHEEYYIWFKNRHSGNPNEFVRHFKNSNDEIIYVSRVDEFIMFREELRGERECIGIKNWTDRGKQKRLKRLKIITFDEWLKIKKNRKRPKL